MQAICTAASLRNTKLKNKPNEDYFICDDDSGIFVLLDGVSRDGNENNYPNPSPSAIISEIVANTVYQYLKRSDMITREVESVLIEAVSYGNDAAKEYNENNIDYFLPGTVGIIAVIKNSILYYLYIGDCVGRFINENEQHIFTHEQTKLISENQKYFSKREVRVNVCNNIFHPYKYGVINGESAAVSFAELGSIILQAGDRVIISSDGMENYLKTLSVKQLRENTADGFIKEARMFNNKNSDDRTIICIDLKED
ncbi:MAG: protein phosphatase 2C domain-containing protein [Peptococcaceae bacterium]|nr:protein phosphatase 2C domain-containing protein [Peptococcaceae bacterium]